MSSTLHSQWLALFLKVKKCSVPSKNVRHKKWRVIFPTTTTSATAITAAAFVFFCEFKIFEFFISVILIPEVGSFCFCLVLFNTGWSSSSFFFQVKKVILVLSCSICRRERDALNLRCTVTTACLPTLSIRGNFFLYFNHCNDRNKIRMSHGQYKATMIVNYVTIFIKSNLYESRL